MIYNKKYIFGSYPCFWNFLSDKSDKDVFFYVNEMTFGQHLRMGASHQKKRLGKGEVRHLL